MNPTCKTCSHFNFKVSTDHAWGECLNPGVQESQHISLSLVHEVFNHPDPNELMNGIDNYARILYREDTFGCRFHSGLSAVHLEEAAGRL